MKHQNRRRFLQRSLAAAAATPVLPVFFGALAPSSAFARTRRPEDVVRIGVIGLRGRGRAHIGAFKRSPDAEVVALCDPDEGVLQYAQPAVPEAKYYKDLRRMLEDPSIDAVSIATPNHWHSLASIWALQAGKHVYVEKPLSHTVWEGRKLVEAADKYGRVLQHGTQARSYPATRDAIAYLHSGALGAVRVARGLCYKRRQSLGQVAEPQAPPATCDYDLWTGPARLEPLRRSSLHYDWHWVFNTGNGDIGNQGVHQLDIARWGLGRSTLPTRVASVGGRLGYEDDGETPNSQVAYFDYGEQELLFEVRGLKTEAYRETHIGVVFHCEKGYLVISSYAKCAAFDHDGEVLATFEGEGDHFQDFLNAVRAGKPEQVRADCREGHLSSALAHLANISYRLGQPARLNATDGPFGAEADSANESFLRFREHLGANGLPPADTSYARGPLLTLDPETERFLGDQAAEANALARRTYREGFEVLEQI